MASLRGLCLNPAALCENSYTSISLVIGKMPNSRKVRTAMKKFLEPFLKEEGFTGKFPHFQRKEGESLQLLSVIYDKWGGGFVLEFANHPTGPLTTSWGPVIPEREIEIGYAPLDKRARLVRESKNRGSNEEFFRYEEIAENKEQCEALVALVINLFPQVNKWLRHREIGKNVSPYF